MEAATAAAGEEDRRDLAKEAKVFSPLTPPPGAKEAISVGMVPSSGAMVATRTMEVSQSGPVETTVECPTQCDPLSHLSPFQRLRACFGWWQHHAPQYVLDLIKWGVEPTFQGNLLQVREQLKSAEDILLAQEVIQDYVQAKAAKEVSLQGTRYLVPWFVIQKVEPSGKIKNRLISDCREINKELTPPRFKLDHWKDIFPQLEKGMWATKVDLKNAYFHLELSQALKPFIRMKIGEKFFRWKVLVLA